MYLAPSLLPIGYLLIPRSVNKNSFDGANAISRRGSTLLGGQHGGDAPSLAQGFGDLVGERGFHGGKVTSAMFRAVARKGTLPRQGKSGYDPSETLYQVSADNKN